MPTTQKYICQKFCKLGKGVTNMTSFSIVNTTVDSIFCFRKHYSATASHASAMYSVYGKKHGWT